MRTVSVTLQGAAIAHALGPVAYSFAWLVIRDTALRVKCEALTEEQRLKMRDCRAALESVLPDLPPVPEPVWLEDYRRADMLITKKGRTHNVAGIAMVIGQERKPMRGAKRYPFFTNDKAMRGAQAWRDAFLALIAAEGQEQV